MPTQGKIRVFVSSTIRDFGDLRSAIRHWLTELGFEVLLSEYNDFDRTPDAGTFRSCFEAISTCDYFLLLIGDHVGSDFSSGVSVTRKEFQVAKGLAEEGRIIIVPCVRQLVKEAMILDDEAAARLVFHVRDGAVEPSLIHLLTRIREFITEVESTKVDHKLDSDNGRLWFYKFQGMTEIAASLKYTVGAHRNLRRHALLANLRLELEANLATLIENRKTWPRSPQRSARILRARLQLTNDRAFETIRLSREDAGLLLDFQLELGRSANIRDHSIREAIQSGEFLTFDRTAQRFEGSDQLLAMQLLIEEHERLRLFDESLKIPPMSEELGKVLNQYMVKSRAVEALGMLVIGCLAMHGRVENILRLSVALLEWIVGDNESIEMPNLIPTAIDQKTVEDLKAERPPVDLLYRWISNAITRRMITGEGVYSEDDVTNAFAEFGVPE